MSAPASAAGPLTGRVAVVFGATGWIGSAICRELSRAGASVVLVGRDADRLDSLARELGSTELTMTAVADVTAALEGDDVRVAALARFGHVDLLVVCSGVMTGSAFEEGVPADWAEMIDVNLRGLLHASQSFAEPLLESAEREGVSDMVLIGAVSTDVRSPRFAVFNALSASIKQLARALRHEYGPRNMRVHVIEPSYGAETDHNRETSPVRPEAIAAVAALASALPVGTNLAETLLLPTGPA